MLTFNILTDFFSMSETSHNEEKNGVLTFSVYA